MDQIRERQLLGRARRCHQSLGLRFSVSAVDAHVGRAIFSECILGALRGKTRLLATHQLQFLSQADLILVLHEGRLVEAGTYQELLSNRGEFAR